MWEKRNYVTFSDQYKRIGNSYNYNIITIFCNYSVLLRNPQFLHKVEKWKRAEKNQRNVNIQEAKKVVC